MTAISAPDLALLRTTRHASSLHLAVYLPTAIWTARVNGTQADGDTTITVDGVSQVRAPQANYQVLFGSTAGARDLGTARFKSYSAPTLTVGAHNSTLTDDAFVTILEFIPPEAILVDISLTDVVSEDGNIAYVSDNNSKSPLARIGTPAVVWRDNITGLGTINFFSDSIAIAPAATISTHAWDFRDGTPGTSASAGTTGAPIAVTFPSLGWRYIKYTVTDSNGTTHTRFNPVLVDDKDSPQYCHSQIELGQCEVDDKGSASIPVTVHTNADQSDFPEGAQVIIFSDDYFDDALDYVSLYPHRENIVVVGWIRAGSTRFDANHSTVEFRVESLGAIASNMTNIGGGLESVASPTGWHQIKNLTHNLAGHHVLVHHTTLSQIADVYPELTAFANDYIDLTDSNIADNLTTQIASPTAGKFGCSLQGAIYLQPDQQLMALASRSIDYLINLTTTDLRDVVEFGDQTFEPQTSQVDLVCDQATGDAYFSIAHQYQMPFGQYEHIEGYRADSQNASNILSGMLLASRNNSPKETILRLRGNYRFLQPFPIQPITVTFAANTNARGITWSSQRCWITRTTLQYNPSGHLLVDITVEKDSSGPAGITGDYPDTIPNPEPTPIIPVEITPLDPFEPPQPIGKGNLLYVSSLKGVAKCVMAYGTNGTDGTPVWSAINTGLSGTALQVRAFNLDPWSIVTDHFTQAYAMTDDGLYKCTGLPDAAVWTQVLSLTALGTLISSATPALAYSFALSSRRADFIAVIGIDVQAGFNCKYFLCWSTDGGANWNTSAPTYYFKHNISHKTTLELQASNHLNNTLYLSAFTPDIYPTPQSVNCSLIKIDSLVTPTFTPYQWSREFDGRYYFPFTNPAGTVYADDDVGYWFGGTTPFDIQRLSLSSATFPTQNLGTDIRPGNTQAALYSHTYSENYLYSIPSGNTDKICFSSDRGANWTDRQPSAGAFFTKSLFPILVDRNIVFAIGRNLGDNGAMAYFSIDFGATWTRFDNPGSGTLDTVLGLGAGDMAQSTIIPDYYKP